VKFINLHHHSTFSTGDGFGTPTHHVARAVELGYQAIALTEHGNVSSHFQLEQAALKAGIKPIFGLEAYCGSVEEDTRQQFKNHLTILARNADGYRSLNRVVTQSYRDFYYHPTVSGISLAENQEGLAILSGCSGSLLACSLLGGKGIPEPEGCTYAWWDARIVIERFQAIFGEWYFLEVQPFPELERTCLMNQAYEKLSVRLGVPLVAACDVHYPKPDDAEMQAVLHAATRGSETVDDQMRKWNYEVKLTLPESEAELMDKLERTGISAIGAMKAIGNAGDLAAELNVTLPKAARLVYPQIESDYETWTE
jgi:DNA polymerase-3 subunit alpha